MGKVRSGSHLLEAFRAGGRREGQPLPIQPPPRLAHAAAGAPPVRELSLGDPACLVVRFSATVLATVVLVSVVLVVGAFLLGRGSAGRPAGEVKGTAPAKAARETPVTEAERRATLPPAVPSQTPATPPEAGASQAAVFAVQVAVYGPGKANLSEDLRVFLQSRIRASVEVKQAENQYRVLVGRFRAADDPVALQALQTIKQLRYGNSDFRDALIVRVP